MPILAVGVTQSRSKNRILKVMKTIPPIDGAWEIFPVYIPWARQSLYTEAVIQPPSKNANDGIALYYKLRSVG